MGHGLFFHVLWLHGLLWRCRFLYEVWPRGRLTTGQTTPTLAMPTTQPSNTPKLFPGLTHNPRCGDCEHATESCQQAPSAPLPQLTCMQGRHGPKTDLVDVSAGCRYTTRLFKAVKILDLRVSTK